MKRLIPIALVFIMLPLHADWSDHGLALLSSGVSSQENATKFELKDAAGRVFYVNSVGEPDGAEMKRIMEYKNEIFSWKQAEVKELSFYMYEKGIQAVVVPSAVTHDGADLKPNLPAGFTFIEGKDGMMNYRYRIIVGNTSLKLDGSYKGEEPLLKEMHDYVRGISEGQIVVEDERVVSGSVVSITGEKEKGEKQVHPIGDLPDFDKKEKETTDAGSAEDDSGQSGKIQIYASARGSYLVPVSFFGDIFIGGYGFTVSAGLCDLGFSLLDRTLFKFEFELFTGYWQLDERKQRTDYTDSSITNAFIVPIGLTGRYRIRIFRGFSMAPSLGFGYFYNKLNYDRLLPDGTVERVSVREWIPSLMFGIRFDYRFGKMFIFTGLDFLVMFERRLNVSTLMFNAGGGYIF